ncbi:MULTISPECIES: hypothetical protein [Bacillus cereus group]|uniref:hypothetical protein n=1 Tax=Bacillus cereus group TaxID=86661 RepID=UPI001F24FC7B|nr:hypothetical protein [Bacillus cereus]MDA1521232.1 hypothetical protein [Bacillus cereus]BCC09350.1 hypothetical protein BCM0060_p2016 [Bacillus cereus]BCC16560.1 hypothetical protein BCM0075_1330 [Bacillus cereus]BCD08755.1 hypothetical protein BC30052_p2037 [Bacillus cereus]HDR7981304.1 hypothetical protein [Bacillus cereus]
MLRVKTIYNGNERIEEISLEDLILITTDLRNSIPGYMENFQLLINKIGKAVEKIDEIEEYQSDKLLRHYVDINYYRSCIEYIEAVQCFETAIVYMNKFERYSDVFAKDLVNYGMIEIMYKRKPLVRTFGFAADKQLHVNNIVQTGANNIQSYRVHCNEATTMFKECMEVYNRFLEFLKQL